MAERTSRARTFDQASRSSGGQRGSAVPADSTDDGIRWEVMGVHVDIVPAAGQGGGDEFVYRIVTGPVRGLEFGSLVSLFEYAREHGYELQVERHRLASPEPARIQRPPNTW